MPRLPLGRIDFVALEPVDGIDVLLVTLAEVNDGVAQLRNVRSFARNRGCDPIW